MDVSAIKQLMHKSVEALKNELATIRAGRANPSLLEHIKADVYGTQMPLLQLATIAVASPQLLVVTPFDPVNTESIAKAIAEANLGFNPVAEKTIIRVPIPPLSQERRQQFIKLANQMMEQGKVRLRQIRQEAMSKVEKELKAKQISEDVEFAQEKEIQKTTDEFMDRVNQMAAAKEQELLTV